MSAGTLPPTWMTEAFEPWLTLCASAGPHCRVSPYGSHTLALQPLLKSLMHKLCFGSACMVHWWLEPRSSKWWCSPVS